MYIQSISLDTIAIKYCNNGVTDIQAFFIPSDSSMLSRPTLNNCLNLQTYIGNDINLHITKLIRDRHRAFPAKSEMRVSVKR